MNGFDLLLNLIFLFFDLCFCVFLCWFFWCYDVCDDEFCVVCCVWGDVCVVFVCECLIVWLNVVDDLNY